MKTVIFSHGKESGPNGNKIRELTKVARARGWEPIALDYTQCACATERVNLLKEFFVQNNFESVVLVGSSMGGYVSTAFSNDCEIQGMFLMCPALYMKDDEYEVQSYYPRCGNIEIVHGWHDDVVPFESSIKFGKQVKAVLTLVDDDHFLKKSLPFLTKKFEDFLKKIDEKF